MRRSIAHDAQSLILDGRRLQLVSGAFHYFRVPRSEWADRLAKSKQAGLNTIETVVPWNAHEGREGRFDFGGNRDLQAFLRLCGDLGLHTFVRPSPYICAEWDNGGIPAWLAGKSGAAFRRSNPVYLAHIARWYDELIPRIAGEQWTRGGSVILVQIENEYAYFQDAQDASYMEFQRDALRARGIEVPLCTCDWPGKGTPLPGTFQGGNCGSGFREAIATLRRVQPDAPAFITELWLAWFDAWGGRHHTRPARDVARALREVLAAGGHYNFYMWAGGTNPGYTAGRTTTGDYGAFITTSYDYDAPIGETGNLTPKYHECRLVNWLAQSLSDVFAGSAEAQTRWRPTNPETDLVARRGPAGTALFLRNRSESAQAVHLEAGGARFPEAFDWTIPARETVILLEDLRLTETTTLARCSAEVLALVGGSLLVYGEPGAFCEVVGASGTVAATFPEDATARVLPLGDARVVLLNRATAGVTWIEDGAWRIDPAYGRRAGRAALPDLDWEWADPLAALDRRPAATCPTLLPLEDFGILHGYGWYRTRFAHPGGETALVLPGVHDRATVFVNGERQGVIGSFAEFACVPIRARPGDNDLCILADPLGRYTFTSRIGERKGLKGTAHLGGEPADMPPWTPAGGRHEIPLPWHPGTGLLLRIAGLTNRPATIGVDGHPLHRHRSIGDDDEWVELDVTPHLRPGGNTLWMEGELQPLPHVRAVRYDLFGQIAGPWLVSGGVAGEPGEIDIDASAFDALPWAPLAAGAQSAGRPALYRASFSLDLPDGAIPVQLLTQGLRKGVAWINGHHLGRYWDLGPQRALVVPREWLAAENMLVIFDEEGRRPEGVRLIQQEGFVEA